MKKVISLLMVLLILTTSLTVYAATDPVVDMAELLTDEQERKLTDSLAAYGNGTLCVVTLNSLEGEYVEDYAEAYAENNDVGVLLLISMEERKWCITASEQYSDVISGRVIDSISDACLPYLQSGDYYSACVTFADRCGSRLVGNESGGSSGNVRGWLGRVLICLLIGLAAGGITAGIMAGKNRSVRPKNSAADYVRSGSMVVNVSRDMYLYHHVTRTPKPQNHGSHGGGGGSRSTRSGRF